MPEKAFQGGKIDFHSVVAVASNACHLVLGLTQAHRKFGENLRTVRRAANGRVFAKFSNDHLGLHPSPIASSGAKVCDTHVARALLETGEVDPGCGYARALLAKVRVALRFQRPNVWNEDSCSDLAQGPLTHSIGCARHCVIEAWRGADEPSFPDAIHLTTDTAMSTTLAVRGLRALEIGLDAGAHVRLSVGYSTACALLVAAVRGRQPGEIDLGRVSCERGRATDRPDRSRLWSSRRGEGALPHEQRLRQY